MKIRKLWYLFSRIGINPLQEEHSTLRDVVSLLRRALGLTDADIIPLEFRDYQRVEEDGSLRKFNLFLQYSWFYDYYTRKYPPQP